MIPMEQEAEMRWVHEDRKAVRRECYPQSETEIVSPFFHTKCICGKEFLRIHRRQLITCPGCGRIFEAGEDETEKAC